MPEPQTETMPLIRSTAPRGAWLVLMAILLVGLLLRVAYLRENLAKPEFTVPAIDAGFHDYWARGLAFGEWIPPHDYPDPQLRQSPYLRPPGYPYFLSIVYRLAGPGYLAPRIVQMGLGLASCLLAFWFARRWFGSTVALITAACIGVYWIFVYFEGELHAPALLICLLWLAVIAAGLWRDKPKSGYALAAGLLLGAAALVRPNVLLFVPVVIGWAWWLARRRGNRRHRLVGLAGFLLGLAVAIAPATIRNYLVAGDFVLISSNAGINLYMGNNELTDGRVARTIPGLGRFHTCYDYPALVKNLERRLGHELKDSQVSAHFTAEALRFIRRHPGRFITLTLRKAVLFWSPHEVSHNKMIDCERAYSPVLSRIPGHFALLLGMFVLGMVRFGRQWQAQSPQATSPTPGAPDPARWEMTVLFLLIIAAYFLAVVPFFMAARYRTPIIPFVILIGAYGLEGVIRSAGPGGSWRAAVLGFAWLVLCLVLGRSPDPHPVSQSKWHADRGAAYLLSGRMDGAIAQYRSSLQLNPRFAEAHYNLSLALACQGKLDEAIYQGRRFVEAEPDETFGYSFLADLLVQTGRYQEAGAVLQQGLAAPRIDPYLMARAARFFATCPREDLRDAVEALRLAQEACRLTDHERPRPLAALADAYAANGQPDRAVEAAKRALQLAIARHNTELVAELENKLQTYRSAPSND